MAVDKGNEIDHIVRMLKMDPSNFGYTSIEFGINSNSKRFCCLKQDWKIMECDQMFSGPAAERLNLISKGKKSDVYQFKVDGKSYVSKSIKLSRWIKFHQGDVFNIKNLRSSLSSKAEILKHCFKTIEPVYGYIGMDEYANELSVGSLVDDYTRGTPVQKLVNIPQTYTICGKWGLYISELATRGDISSFSMGGGDFYEIKEAPLGQNGYVMIKPSILLDIIVQVMSTLDLLLEKGHFLHGDLKVRNVLINPGAPFRETYKGMNFGSSGIRAIISDFGNSSITYKTNDGRSIRIFSEVNMGKMIARQLGDFEAEVQLGNSCLAVPVGRPGEMINSECRTSYWWKLPSRFDNINLLILSHSGMPFYHSIDFYVFMTSLFMIPRAYNGGIERDIYKIWSSMWRSDELNSVNADVKKYHPKGGHHKIIDILSILRKYHMRCDAMEYAMLIVKQIQK
jgi:hypothetical protein